MKSPIVSIVIPIYNVAPYIKKCMESVVSQTFNGCIECILVDDCGTDNSMDLVRDFISEYKGTIKFRIVSHSENKGLSAARNTGIRESEGDWLYFLDSDDWMEPDCILSLYFLVKKYPDVEMVQAGANVIGSKIDWMDFTKKDNLPEYANNKMWISKALLQRFTLNMTAWNKLLRRDFIEKYNLAFAEGYLHEDEIFNVALATCLERMAICKRNTYNYLLRPNSIVTKVTDMKSRVQRLRKVWDVEYEIADASIKTDLFKAIWNIFNDAFKNHPQDVSPWILMRYVPNFWGYFPLFIYSIMFLTKGIRRYTGLMCRFWVIKNHETPLIDK